MQYDAVESATFKTPRYNKNLLSLSQLRQRDLTRWKLRRVRVA